MHNDNDSAEMSEVPVKDMSVSSNTISLGVEALKDSNDGETITAQIEGVLTISEDGTKSISVKSVDGIPVAGSESEEEEVMTDEQLNEGIESYAKRNAGLMGYK